MSGVTDKDESKTEFKIQRVTSNDDLKEKRSIRYLVNDYYILSAVVNKNSKSDKWSFSDIRKKTEMVTIVGNLRENTTKRNMFAKEVSDIGLMEKKEFNKLLVKMCSRVNGLIDKISPFEEASVGDGDYFDQTSLVFGPYNQVFEQVYDGDKVQFVTLNANSPKYYDVVDDKKPIMGEEVTQKAVLLPSKPFEYGTTETLVNEVNGHIHKYLDIPSEYRTMATFYILMSWLFEKISVLPYLRALGDSGCGKSRMMDVIGRLLYKACMVSGAITPAPIYRLQNKWRGSLIIDEADFKDSSEMSEVITILNCGFEKNRPIIRCDKDNPDDLKFFSSFGPKIIGTRKEFRDYALESRCLTQLMKKTRRKDIPRVLDDRFYEEQQVLRNKLLMFRLKHWSKIDVGVELDFDFSEIDPRIEQVMRGFFVLFRNIPGVSKKFEEFMVKFNNSVIEQRAESMAGWIINTIVDLVMESEEPDPVITSTDVVERINRSIKDEKKKKTASTIGKYLRNLGIETESEKVDGVTKRVIKFDSTFLLVFKSYVPRDGVYMEKLERMMSVTGGYRRLQENAHNDSAQTTLVTGVTGLSLALQKKIKKGSTNIAIQEDPKKENPQKTNVFSSQTSPVTVTPVTDVTTVTDKNSTIDDKLKKWREMNLKEVPKNSLRELFDISESEIENMRNMGLIFEASPGKYNFV